MYYTEEGKSNCLFLLIMSKVSKQTISHKQSCGYIISMGTLRPSQFQRRGIKIENKIIVALRQGIFLYYYQEICDHVRQTDSQPREHRYKTTALNSPLFFYSVIRIATV